MRLLGIDFGTKKIGLAISDTNGRFAMPFKVIKNDTLKSIVAEVVGICQAEKIDQIVIGKSVNYQNEANPVDKSAQVFATNLQTELDIPVVFEVETLTTKEAERIIGKDSLTDARAAALILKSFIDRQN